MVSNWQQILTGSVEKDHNAGKEQNIEVVEINPGYNLAFPVKPVTHGQFPGR